MVTVVLTARGANGVALVSEAIPKRTGRYNILQHGKTSVDRKRMSEADEDLKMGSVKSYIYIPKILVGEKSHRTYRISKVMS